MQNIKSKNIIIAFCAMQLLSACGNSGTTSQPNSDTTPELANTTRGKEIFNQRCMGCHGLNGDAQLIGAANLQLTKLDSLGVATTIKTGRNKMPPFGNSFSDSDMAQLVQYVMTFRKRG